MTDVTTIIEELNDRCFRLKRPIQVRVETYPEGVGVYWDETHIFGEGEDLDEAIGDFQRNTSAQFEDLEDREPELSATAAALLKRLRGFIVSASDDD